MAPERMKCSYLSRVSEPKVGPTGVDTGSRYDGSSRLPSICAYAYWVYRPGLEIKNVYSQTRGALHVLRITLHNKGNEAKPINIAPKPSDGALTANPIIVRCELNCPAGRMYPPSPAHRLMLPVHLKGD